MSSTTRKDAEAHYRRKLDKWKSRSARIIGKAQALNRTQDRKLSHELDMIDKTREYCIRRTQEDIWKVNGADCPVPRLPKPSDLPTYMAGVRPATVTLPTPAELASLLPKKIIRQQPKDSNRSYTHIPRKRLSLMSSAEVQIFHYRRLLERQEEIKSQVVTIFSSLVTDDKSKDKKSDGAKAINSTEGASDSSGTQESTPAPVAKKPLGAKWAIARNNLKAIAEQKESEQEPTDNKTSQLDENNNNIKNENPPASGSIKVDLELTRVTISRKTIPENETPKRRLSIDETPYVLGNQPVNKPTSGTPSSSVSSSKLKYQRSLRPHSSYVKPSATDMRVYKKPRPSTSNVVNSASRFSGNSNIKSKVLRTNYAAMYQKQMLEHKKRMSASGNLSDESRRSSITSSSGRNGPGMKPMEVVVDLEEESDDEEPVQKQSILSRIASNISASKKPNSQTSKNAHSRQFSPNLNDSSSYGKRNSLDIGTPSEAGDRSRSRSPSPFASNPSTRGIRQPGNVTPLAKRESTLLKETAASNRRRNRKISLQRTSSGMFINDKLFQEIQQMRNVKEELCATEGTVVDGKSAADIYNEMKYCRYLRRGSGDDDSLPPQPLSEQLQMLRLNSANEKRESFLSKLKEEADQLGVTN